MKKTLRHKTFLDFQITWSDYIRFPGISCFTCINLNLTGLHYKKYELITKFDRNFVFKTIKKANPMTQEDIQMGKLL